MKTARKPKKSTTIAEAEAPVSDETGTCPRIFLIQLAYVSTPSVNDLVYGAIDPDDPSLDDLVYSMETKGQLEPIVLTEDDAVMAGNRRCGAARRLGWTDIKARRHQPPVYSIDPDFEKLLVAYNTQRDKSPDVRAREQIVLTNADSAYENLTTERVKASRVKADRLTLGACRKRSRISPAKKPFLDAIDRIIKELEAFWPLSDRRVHYMLVNCPPLIHARKPDSRYRNNAKSYKATCELLTRARLAGLIPFDAIGDETRPVTTWDVYQNISPFYRHQVDSFATGYWRDLMQSQPHHVEIVGEKLTVEGIVRPVASKYCIPYTIGRGYSSLPPRKAMYERWKKSGKDKLIILFLSDHDPEGWDIAETFAKSMRDDFEVPHVIAVKVGLKPEQVAKLGLPPNADAKPSSSRFAKFSARFGPAAYELEAVAPTMLQDWLDAGVRSVINVERFNDQVEEEKKEARYLIGLRTAARQALLWLPLPDNDE